MVGGVEDCTFKDMIPIKNRFSNLDLYPGKASKQKIITINSKKYVLNKEMDGAQKRDKSAKEQVVIDSMAKILMDIDEIKEKMNDMQKRTEHLEVVISGI